MHVTLVPYLKGSGEHKSKPTQHSVGLHIAEEGDLILDLLSQRLF